ncbi:hypothetical protein L3W93_23380, partial [Escherichia coli]|nr:hypothetical protein [Escherichia coli]
NHTDCPLTDFGGKTSIFSHPVYLFLRKFSLQDSRGGSLTAGAWDSWGHMYSNEEATDIASSIHSETIFIYPVMNSL